MDAVGIFGVGNVGCLTVVWVSGHVDVLGFGRCVEVLV